MECCFCRHVGWYRNSVATHCFILLFLSENSVLRRANRKRTFWLSYLAGFLVASIIAVFSVSMLNKIAPQKVNWQALQLTDLNGTPIVLSDYKGKIVLLNIWATWSKASLQEMPSLQRLQQLHPDKVVIFAISDEATNKVEKFIQANSFNLHFVKANTPLASQHLTMYPATYLLAPNGELESIYLGAQTWDSEKMQAYLLSID
ncbi:hypothetical protein DP923_03900 [Pontibacter arcticus]|uniref:Thioredoxin domain-containing protein n=1 Tax=Pontibacter arcticus TaxID=2080288 RepID=A0A364RIU5_9BACT|nr:hypothetical protein DP923_03900 [Pontibacter arcticus]